MGVTAMTAQIGDLYQYGGAVYTIVARRGDMPFHPSEYGITPKPVCTACWRGYWCVYNITEEGVFLEELYIHSGDDTYPPIAGVLPEEETYMGHHRYGGLHLRLPFTGRVLIGKDFLRQYYIHMGYQRPWAYETLIELVFKDGKLVETKDESLTAAVLRETIPLDRGFRGRLLRRRRRGEPVVDPRTRIWWLK